MKEIFDFINTLLTLKLNIGGITFMPIYIIMLTMLATILKIIFGGRNGE